MFTPTGLFETHLTVQNLTRSIAFYRDVVGLPLAYVVEERRVAFMWIGAPGEAMLGLWEAPGPMGLRLHFALRMSEADVVEAPAMLRARGVVSLDFYGNPSEIAYVIGWMPAVCVFFKDPDGHSVEFISMVSGPPQPEPMMVPWSQWHRPSHGSDANRSADMRG